LKYLVVIWLFIAATANGAQQKAWYLHFGLGFSTTQLMGSDAQRLAQAPKNNSFLQTNVDLPGIYLPWLGHRLMTGISFGGGESEFLLQGALGSEQVSLTTVRAGLSFLYFPAQVGGEGFFLRLDGGPGYVAFTPQNHATDPLGARTGLSLLAGGGWSFAASESLRVLLQLNYSLLALPNYRVGMMNATVGLML